MIIMMRIMYSGHNPISKQSINIDGGGEEGEEDEEVVEEEEIDSLHTVFLELYPELIAYLCLFKKRLRECK